MKQESAGKKGGTGGYVLRPTITSELAALYGVDPKTFRKWVAPHKEAIGERTGWYYSVKQVKIIFRLLDIPKGIEGLLDELE